jgi:mRNA-degrading endonuclease RelE of RelBE toxin-antitoxin system
MEFRIADTFTDSLSKLTNQEQKAVKTTAFDLQINPVTSGLRFHKLDRAKDPNFWSVSINMDIRLIVHKTAASLLLCYVDHHDKAYTWASKRKIERHPTTGAAQLVEIRETIEEVILAPAPTKLTAPRQPTTKPAKPQPPLFAKYSEADLLAYGIPPEWLATVQQATEATLFDIADRLPQEATEALLELATGGTPQPPTILPDDIDPFDHPDAQRRFRVMTNSEELQRALDYPWEKWTVFLHPSQRQLVERDFTGPARVSGSAGTGKTIVALHRSVHLARQHPTATILLTTLSESLANALKIKVDRLIGNEPNLRNRIHIRSIRELAYVLYTRQHGQPQMATEQDIRQLLTAQSAIDQNPFTESFLLTEWRDVVDAWQITTLEGYQNVPRLGRKTRLGSKQRDRLWQIFAQLQQKLTQQNRITWSHLLHKIADTLKTSNIRPFDFAVIDEAQDIGIPELRFLSIVGDQRSDSLLFTGDLGQRIFQQPFSWKALGVDLRGRSHTLSINYRTSHQIRSSVDRLLPNAITDVDGNTENRRNTISVFNGPIPIIHTCETPEAEIATIADWITQCREAGIQPDEIGIFVRDTAQIDRAIATARKAGIEYSVLDDQLTANKGSISISTMHLAKGLEFRAVAVMACDDEVIPLQTRIDEISDEADLEEVYNTERHLLYVACTRARDQLLITGVDPASEFLDDLT